jgi:glycosyltransferase involved in cell wall biosynthesis
MRIGLDFRPAMMATTGIGRYVNALSERLAKDCDLRLFGVFRKGNCPEVRKAPAGARLLAWPIPSRAMNFLGPVLPVDRALGGCDLFHHTNFQMAPVARSTPEVITLHDLAFLREPELYTPRMVNELTRLVRRAVDRCAAFCVPSEAVASDCRELLGLDRIFVTPLGVAANLNADFEPPDRPYILMLGTLEPRKNHLRVLRAFAELDVDVDLHLVGGRGWMCDDVLELAERTPRVTWSGHLSEPDLRRELAGAQALVYPSLLEGFGLPVLEANAAGIPALTSDRAPMRTDAAYCVDPTDEEAIRNGMECLLTDAGLRQELITRGFRRAERRTWQRCADATREVYDAAIA